MVAAGDAQVKDLPHFAPSEACTCVTSTLRGYSLFVNPNVDQLIPEWTAFRETVTSRRPDHGTACAAWTVRDLVAHQAANAEELGRILGAHLAGEEVPRTRSFEEREPAYREMPDGELFGALDRQIGQLAGVLEEANEVDQEEIVPWTGRAMKVPWFGEHMREELILHRWDIVGDDLTSMRLLNQSWLTTHSVYAVGEPLLKKGASEITDGRTVKTRLRSPGRDDVVVEAAPPMQSGPSESHAIAISLGPREGEAVLECDAAARVLLLWGRQPSDPGRITSHAGPVELGRVRALLAGY